MEILPPDARDRELIEAAQKALRDNFSPGRHTKGAAVRAGSGKLYCGVNVEGCAYGPCAEAVAIGGAFSHGERSVEAVVAVRKDGDAFSLVPPCGTCRQLLVDYAPGAVVLLSEGAKVVKVKAVDLLPRTYFSKFD